MRHVHFAAAELVELFHRDLRRRVCRRRDREADQRLVQVERGVADLEDVLLHVGDRVDDVRADERDLRGNARERLHRVHHHRRRRVHLVGVASRHNAPVLQLDRRARDDRAAGLALAGELRFLGRPARRLDDHAVLRLERQGVHQLLRALDHRTRRGAFGEGALVAEEPADDLLARGVAHDLVVDDAEADAVDAHVRRRLVGTGPFRHLLPDRHQQGEGVDVAVVVDRLDAVGLLVVRIDHVLVVQVDRRRLVGDVERMVQGKVPHRERLELRVAGGLAHAVLVVDLRQARRELPGARTRRRHDHDRSLGLHVLVLAVAHVGHDRVDVRRIAGGLVVVVDPDAAALELRAELHHGRLLLVARDDDAADRQAQAAQVVDQLQRVVRIGNAEVGAHLLALDVAGEEAEDHFRLVLEGLQQTELHVRVVPGQAPRRVEVVDELAAELQVEPPVLAGAPTDFLGLLLQVLIVVKAKGHGIEKVWKVWDVWKVGKVWEVRGAVRRGAFGSGSCSGRSRRRPW